MPSFVPVVSLKSRRLERYLRMTEQPGRRFPKWILVTIVILLLAVAAYVVVYRYTTGIIGGSPPNPCGQVSESPTPYAYVDCRGLEVTERGASCSLSTGICTMALTNNFTARNLEVFTTSCLVDLISSVNGTGSNRTIGGVSLYGVSGGPAALGVPPGTESSATCAFPTNRYMANITLDQGINGCFGVAQVGNESNSVSLCWDSSRWSAAPVAVEPLDCPSMLSRVTVSPNGTLRAVIANGNSFDVWVTSFNGSSTVGPNGYAVYGPYSGETSAIATHYVVPAGSSSFFFLPGALNPSRTAPYTLSFLPTNETITYTSACEMTYTGASVSGG